MSKPATASAAPAAPAAAATPADAAAMPAAPGVAAAPGATDGQRMAAEDLRALAWLHAQERSPEVLLALHGSGFPASISLLGAGHPAVQAFDVALRSLSGQVAEVAACTADDLAADYAAIYLTHNLRAAPHESVWRDEDHLMLQGPAFAVRDFYRKHGVQVQDWRQMNDDHLTHELNFVALLLERGQAKEANRFLKQHLLAWLPEFAQRVAQRAATPLYAALAVLTHAACEALSAQLPAVALMPAVRTATASSTVPPGCGG